jgi:hypothetical protein
MNTKNSFSLDLNQKVILTILSIVAFTFLGSACLLEKPVSPVALAAFLVCLTCTLTAPAIFFPEIKNWLKKLFNTKAFTVPLMLLAVEMLILMLLSQGN